jgi:hypothetical protein
MWISAALWLARNSSASGSIEAPCRSGKVKTRLKVKNPAAPAILRFQEVG